MDSIAHSMAFGDNAGQQHFGMMAPVPEREQVSRNPSIIFNEKAVLRLGRGMQSSGRLNDEGTAQALTVMNRYTAIARAW